MDRIATYAKSLACLSLDIPWPCNSLSLIEDILLYLLILGHSCWIFDSDPVVFTSHRQ